MAEEKPMDPGVQVVKSPLFRMVHGAGSLIAASSEEVIIQFFSEYPAVPADSSVSSLSESVAPLGRIREVEFGVVISVKDSQRIGEALIAAGQHAAKEERSRHDG